MCEKCKPLIECPVGQKRSVKIGTMDLPPLDPYGHALIDDGKEMFVDKWPNGYTGCGIYGRYHDENNVCHGAGFTIKHCPFCGEKLV